MSKIITVKLDGSRTVRDFHRCHDCDDCPLNVGAVPDSSWKLPCGQQHCWDDCFEHDCDNCPVVGFCKH